ncbi:hypothetical protein Tco_0410504 [Tanacetum coccineum]
MDDEPMWAADRVVALTPDFTITIPEIANEFSIKEMLQNCHGHNLSKSNITKIFYHGLSEITQEVMNVKAGGIFLYKTLNQAYQLLEDKVLLKLYWAKNKKTKTSLKKTVAFADEVAKNHQASIQNLETKFDRLADKQSGRPSRSFPSNTQPNPRGSNSIAYQPPQARNEHVNAVFTRSGKSYNPPKNPNEEQNKTENPINFDSDDEDDEPTPQPKIQTQKPVKETPLPKLYKPKISYPQHLRKEKMEARRRFRRSSRRRKQNPTFHRRNPSRRNFSEFNEFIAMAEEENSKSKSDTEEPPFKKITINTDYKIKTSLEEPPTDLELKPLPDNLEYIFLEEPSFLPVIIPSQLSAQNKGKLVFVLKKHKIQLLDDKKPTDILVNINLKLLKHITSDLEETDHDDEQEIGEIFRIETNLFDYETPEDGYCNEGNLPGAYIIGNLPHYQDYEWYEALEDGELKKEALRNEAIMEGNIDDDESIDERQEICSNETHELSACNIRRFEMIKYSFRDDEEYVAVKEDEYDDLTSTSKDACRSYQEIFRMMDEGWMVTKDE